MGLSTALFVSTTGKTVNVIPADGTTFTLEELQAFVGGMIEIVALEDGRVMICNEEGKLLGLPLNQIATRMFNTKGRMAFDPIAGDVLICEAHWIEADDEGDFWPDEPDYN